MKITQKFIFVNKNNIRQLPPMPPPDSRVNFIARSEIDRFRQAIGNYWYLRLPNGRVIEESILTVKKANLDFQENKTFPFKIRFGKTHTFSTLKNIPSVIHSTPITLQADEAYFGPYPNCTPCWYRYLYGADMSDPNLVIDKVFGFDPLRIQDIESGFTFLNPADQNNALTVQRVGAVTPLTVLLISDAGLPTTERLAEIGVDLSYLSYGKALTDAVTRLTTAIDTSIGAVQVQVPARLSYKVRTYRDSYFDSEIATLLETEAAVGSEQDFTLNADVKFVHNYEAKTYDQYIASDTPQLGLNAIGGETKLFNYYEAILNKKVNPVIVSLREELECFEQKLVLLFRNYKNDSKVLYVLAETLPLINKFYPFEQLVPYYAKINFPLKATGPLAESMEQVGLEGVAMRHMQETPSIRQESQFNVYKQTLGKRKRNSSYISALVQEDDATLQSWEYYEWVLKIGERIKNISTGMAPATSVVDYLPLDSSIINEQTRVAKATSGTDTPFAAYALATTALHAKVTNVVKQYTRSYPELLKGAQPHKEVMAYKISKYAAFSAPAFASMNEITDFTLYGSIQSIISSEPIQEIWFFNNDKEQVINYVDSQIKNNQYYTYLVTAYVIVLENEYYYTNVGNMNLPCVERTMDFDPLPATPTTTPTGMIEQSSPVPTFQAGNTPLGGPNVNPPAPPPIGGGTYGGTRRR